MSLVITYHFQLADDTRRSYTVELDSVSLMPVDAQQTATPTWTELGFQQCSNCPLKVEQHAHCPVAVRLTPLLEMSKELQSHDSVDVQVLTPERQVAQSTTMQRAMSSLLGLVMATSGCPHTEYLKPMARFHLPLASEDETVYRAASMYLLAQYFLSQRDAPADMSLSGLSAIYKNLQLINTALANRVRAASVEDAAVNAIVLLDLFAKTIPYTVEESLQELEHLFDAYLRVE